MITDFSNNTIFHTRREHAERQKAARNKKTTANVGASVDLNNIKDKMASAQSEAPTPSGGCAASNVPKEAKALDRYLGSKKPSKDSTGGGSGAANGGAGGDVADTADGGKGAKSLRPDENAVNKDNDEYGADVPDMNKPIIAFQVAENIHFGLASAKDILYNFLLDDKDPVFRGHRQNIPI